MAEFCLEHFNQMFRKDFTKKDVVLAYDLCESCGEVKPCVVCLSLRGKIKELREDYKKSKNRRG